MKIIKEKNKLCEEFRDKNSNWVYYPKLGKNPGILTISSSLYMAQIWKRNNLIYIRVDSRNKSIVSKEIEQDAQKLLTILSNIPKEKAPSDEIIQLFIED